MYIDDFVVATKRAMAEYVKAEGAFDLEPGCCETRLVSAEPPRSRYRESATPSSVWNLRVDLHAIDGVGFWFPTPRNSPTLLMTHRPS